MSNTRRKFERPLGKRPYKKLFVIAVEDKVKEPRYFQLFNKLYPQSIVYIECIKGTSESSPTGVLKRMERRLKREALKPYDEAWVVVDKDGWTDAPVDSASYLVKVTGELPLCPEQPQV